MKLVQRLILWQAQLVKTKKEDKYNYFLVILFLGGGSVDITYANPR